MRLLWLTNMAPGPVAQALTGKAGSGLWVDHVLRDLMQIPGLQLCMLCPWGEEKQGSLTEGYSYETFLKVPAEQVSREQEDWFLKKLSAFQPDVIHIWGTEFSHTLSMVRAAQRAGLLKKVVIGIQGLTQYVGLTYLEGLPLSVQKRFTLRDLLRQDNLRQQQKTFLKRGEHEQEALKQIFHTIGRTRWDRECMEKMAPQAEYHFCNETLRESFYSGAWSWDACEKQRIFTSSRLYPIKGFHYVLEAFQEVLKTWPQAQLAVPGVDPLCHGKAKLRQDSYARYLGELTKKYGLQGKIQYLGHLSEAEMKAEFLKANVYVLPSTIENSSNSLGEAMLLGVPCVASRVGGTPTMLGEQEGILYESSDPHGLAEAISRVFSMEKTAETMGMRAADHARRTHDPKANFEALLKIYREIEEASEHEA